MTLPGQEDGLLFQKKMYKTPKLAPMVLLHMDGTESHFYGARLEDDPPHLNRFMYVPKNGQSVILSFDDLKRHKYWQCSCGGNSLPYHVCPHIVYLEIATTDNTLLVLTEDEFKNLSGVPLEDIDFDILPSTLAGQIKDIFPSVFGNDLKEEDLPALPEDKPFDWTTEDRPIPVLKTKRLFADKDEDV